MLAQMHELQQGQNMSRQPFRLILATFIDRSAPDRTRRDDKAQTAAGMDRKLLSEMLLWAVMLRLYQAQIDTQRTGFVEPKSGDAAVPHGL
ncbi:hypothetical protein [Thetidibacter halocola]|uniref:Uncharacterized protein n=1 Tax=Thetidibacter halocola TaxID=2827239 RepID=A0A8J7WJS6_9RHOB|nr:hypothetical protein [Thetidibacter halocola]MBS0126536.1 hypothetical protein [Thetidibacter halocola]